MRYLISLGLLLVLNFSFAAPNGEMPLDDLLDSMDIKNREVVSLNYDEVKQLHPGVIRLDSLLNLGLIRVGTPYLWGGDDWVKGIDCSHFTKKILSEVGKDYAEYLTTEQLKDIKGDKGLMSVPVNEIQPGDLLVYGSYDSEQKWHGHVVLLIQKEFSYASYQGLALGSHGTVGVQYVVYEGFPNYYRMKEYPLVNALRVK